MSLSDFKFTREMLINEMKDELSSVEDSILELMEELEQNGFDMEVEKRTTLRICQAKLEAKQEFILDFMDKVGSISEDEKPQQSGQNNFIDHTDFYGLYGMNSSKEVHITQKVRSDGKVNVIIKDAKNPKKLLASKVVDNMEDPEIYFASKCSKNFNKASKEGGNSKKTVRRHLGGISVLNKLLHKELTLNDFEMLTFATNEFLEVHYGVLRLDHNVRKQSQTSELIHQVILQLYNGDKIEITLDNEIQPINIEISTHQPEALAEVLGDQIKENQMKEIMQQWSVSVGTLLKEGLI